jgi:hypothetical protein
MIIRLAAYTMPSYSNFVDGLGLATTVIREMDANGDGFVSLAEFKVYLKQRREQATAEPE